MSRNTSKPRIGIDVIGVGVGAVIINDQNQLLLLKRGAAAKNERGKWEIPGGEVEFGETVVQALKREVKEEIGVEIEVGEMIQLSDQILPEEGQHWVAPTFLCHIKQGQPHIKEPKKHSRIGWFSPEEAEKLPLAMITLQDVAWLKQQKGS